MQRLNTRTSTYQPNIDGLRTIAVFSVFVFHLSPQTLSGGFVGVDIFFVISGYLITNILKTSVEADNLSFSHFYIRRIKRLFPAFAVVLIATAIAACFVLNPLEIMKFARSSIAAIASVSNIYFFLNSGYFAPAAESQLLLHTWSLSVEEQFYLVWPLLTYLIVTKIPVKLQLKVILVLTVLCMLVSTWVSHGDADMAFYLTPFRAAEFSIGGILCWLSKLKDGNLINETGTLAGLGLITGSLYCVNADMIFPGWVVYIPCIGTAMVIYFSRSSILGQRLVGNTVMAYLGRISYPLYLVHWPLIIFSKQLSGQPLEFTHKLGIFICAVLLAALIHRFIEQPLKTASTLWKTNTVVVRVFAGSLSILTVVFLSMNYFKGFPGQVSPAVSAVIDRVEYEKNQRFQLLDAICMPGNAKSCEAGIRKVVVVLGDSHGPDAINALYPNYETVDYSLQYAGGCPPLSLQDFDKFIKPPRDHYRTCHENTHRLANPDFYADIEYLVISVLFNYWYTPESLDNFLSSIDIPETINLLILGNAPRFNQPLPDLVADHKRLENLSQLPAPELNDLTWKFEEQIKLTAKKHGAKFVSKLDYFCDTDTKRCRIFYGESNKLLSYDTHHLSFEAASLFGQSLKSIYPTIDDLFESSFNLDN